MDWVGKTRLQFAVTDSNHEVTGYSSGTYCNPNCNRSFLFIFLYLPLNGCRVTVIIRSSLQKESINKIRL